MKRFKIILPIVVIIFALLISYSFISSKKKPHHWKRSAPEATVDVVPLVKSEFQVWVASQGTVTPRTESTLIPEVSGRIMTISPSFREGAFFEKNQVLLKIDISNYRIATTIAESKVAEMKLLLAEEQAKARQAKRNWSRLGLAENPSDLVLRQPQLMVARASLASAKAELQQVKLNLQRTRIKAPYAGRVLEQQVDIGQYVSPGSILAKIYAVDYAEIRLPLSDEQLQFIDVPESYRGEKKQKKVLPEVLISTVTGIKHHQWKGRIVRAEGAYDTKSRRLSVVVQVDDPYAKTKDDMPPLKVGQFVEAKIKGKLLQQVFVVPNSAIKDNSKLMIIDQQSRLHVRDVDIIWRDAHHVVIKEGLQEGEWLCMTPVPYAVQGLKVQALSQGKSVLTDNGVTTK